MNQGNYALEVLVNGRSVREYSKEGRSFIEGRQNTNYSIRIRNNSWKRVLALVSVDGLGVVSGKPADPRDAGYIINAWSAIEVKGFRESQATVGSFLFTNRDASYAAGQGVPLNAGVIGVLIVEEKEKPQATYSGLIPIDLEAIWRTSTGSYATLSGCGPIGGDWAEQERMRGPVREGLGDHGQRRITSKLNATYCSSLQPQPVPVAKTFDLGTTWGKRVNDRVTTVEFDRGVTVGQLDLYYASRSSLEALGICFVDETPIAFPQSFPSYAKPPANWRG